MDWAKLVLSYLMHGIEEFNMKKQSVICGCLLFFLFMVMSLYIIYLIVNFEFDIKAFVN